MEIRVKLLHPNAKLPARAYSTDAAFDLFAAEDTIIGLHGVTKIHTGIILDLPEGTEAQIWPRSSDTIEETFIHLGTIDPGYRGEVIILARMFAGCNDRHVKQGDKIGQLKFVILTQCKLSLTNSVSDTERGKDGFGSTGTADPKGNALREGLLGAKKMCHSYDGEPLSTVSVGEMVHHLALIESVLDDALNGILPTDARKIEEDDTSESSTGRKT